MTSQITWKHEDIDFGLGGYQVVDTYKKMDL